jgi:predicted unusual protein kinase regulating ubiquinone biosynthesis (AarF/ABC1/UbiB family)
LETTDNVRRRAIRGAHDVWRIVVVVARLLPLALSLRRDYRRWLFWGVPLARTEAFHRQRARTIVRQFAALGPAFVKLAQIFASRSDLIPEPYLSELGSLTDQVPPIPWPVVRAVIERAWNEAPENVLDELDTTPLAAGSLGQVHRARYQGRDVVVKALRPGVEGIIDRDVRIARWIVDKVYARFPHHHVLGFRVVLEEFDLHVREEMDFEREAMQCTRMRERFRDEPRLRIPKVEEALTRHDVLVLEYLPGTRIDSLHDRIARGELSLVGLVETLIESYARMMLRDGVFHADPHPGNLLVDERGRIILLDFGMVIDVNFDTRKALFRAVVAAVQRDVEATTDSFFELGLVAPGATRETILDLVRTLLEIAYSKSAIHERTRLLAERVMRELFDWPIVLPGELVYFARTAALIEGVGARYDANFNSIRVASPVVIRMHKELLAVLLGDDANDPIVSWAATLGALAGGAAVMLSRTGRELSRFAQEGWNFLFGGSVRSTESVPVVKDPPLIERPGTEHLVIAPATTSTQRRLENPLAKQVEAELITDARLTPGPGALGAGRNARIEADLR